MCDSPGVDSLEDRVRSRILALYERGSRAGEKWTAEKLAKFVGADTPSAVRKLLNGQNRIGLRHIQGFCEAFQVTPAELVLEPGALMQPTSPLEAAIIAHLRQMTELERRSLLTLLERPTMISHRKARMGRAMLSVKEQELVDLFGRVKKDGVRDGVLRTLRGAVEAVDRSSHTNE